MVERILNPFLIINNEPNDEIKFLKKCDLNLKNINNQFFNVKLACELKNFVHDIRNRQLFIALSLANDNKNLWSLPNPNRLFCTDENIRIQKELLKSEEYLFKIDKSTMSCEIDNLRIIENSRNELTEFYEKLAFNCIKDNLEESEEHKIIEMVTNQSKIFEDLLSNQLDKCRLKLKVVIYNIIEKRIENSLTEPVYTNTIYNRYPIEQCQRPKINQPNTYDDTTITNYNNLRILRSSKINGNMDGGEEMILLTTFFEPNDIEVEFFRLKNSTEIEWRSFAKINRTDIHANCALVAQIPKFTDTDSNDSKKGKVDQKIKVYYRLFKPSTKEFSEKMVFYYVKNDNYDLKSLLSSCIIEKKFKHLSLENKKNLKRKTDEKIDIDKDNILDEQKNKIIKTEKIDNKEQDQDVEIDDKLDELKNDSSTLENKPTPIIKTCLEKIETKTLDPVTLQKNLDSCVAKMNALADRTGKSLLKFAKSRSFHELLKTHRFLINTQDEDGNTPIHYCILYKNFDLLAIFVDVTLTIPYQNIINIRNYKSMTGLLMACYMGEIEASEFLLEANADITLADYDGNNPIHVACKTKNLELLKLLLKHADKHNNFGVINTINHEGFAPLHLCVLNDSYEMVRELLYCKDLRINIPDKRSGYTALHYAASNFNANKIAEILIKNEKIDLNCKTYNGCTPLHMAIANKNYLTTILLIQNGADVNLQNDIPIHFDYEFLPVISTKHFKSIEDYLKKLNLNQNESFDVKCENQSFLNEFTKLSEEVKKELSQQFEKNIDDDDSRSKAITHNNDSFTYAFNDPWMQELLKNPKTVSKELILKMACYEKIRKEFYNKQMVKSDVTELIVKSARDVLKSSQVNSFNGAEKLSQQESDESILLERNLKENENESQIMEINSC